MSQRLLSVEEFGKQLFTTGDLDPIYVMLRGAMRRGTMSFEQAKRWCVAYWCYYNAATASYVASAKSDEAFYERMYKADRQKMARGAERRHWRGQMALSTIVWMKNRHPNPLTLYADAVGKRTHFVKRLAFIDVYTRILLWSGFGKWAAFKVTDMLSAVFDTPIDFRASIPHFFRESLTGAALVHAQWSGHGVPLLEYAKETDTNSAIEMARGEVVPALLKTFRKSPVPHAPDRRPEVQEIETVLCKYKSHVSGSYPLGKDTNEVAHVLKDSDVPLARKLRRFLP